VVIFWRVQVVILRSCIGHFFFEWVVLHYNMQRELHVNIPIMWCDTWLAHLCMFVDVVSTCKDRMTYVVQEYIWMQMLVEKLSYEELMGKLYGSFYEKHLEVLLLNKANVLVWLSFELEMTYSEFWFWQLKPSWFILLLSYFE